MAPSSLSLFGLMLLTGCLVTGCSPKTSSDDPNFTKCEEPRPQVCTQDYRPVCAELQNGETTTYANGCTACSDVNVVAYRPEECA